ncbi:MAG: hypothetical protein R3C25_11770 [Hyphomonadaceae bacterium]
MDLRQLSCFVDPTGRGSNPRMINAVAAYCGVHLASPVEIVEGQELAQQRIGGPVVSASMLQAVQDITGSSVFVARELGKVTGLTAFFLLRPEGMRAFAERRFDTVDVNLDYVCRPREAPAGGYAWGFVASTDRAAGRVVKASLAIRETLFWNLGGYTRAATDDGARLVYGSLGFTPVPGDATLAQYAPREAPFAGLALPRAA